MFFVSYFLGEAATDAFGFSPVGLRGDVDSNRIVCDFPSPHLLMRCVAVSRIGTSAARADATDLATLIPCGV